MRMSLPSVSVAVAVAVTAAFITNAVAQNASTTEETPESLPDFKGREETFGYCIGCHSFQVVGRQGMDRARWDQTLTWMSEKHNMPEPDAQTRKVLLDYLAQAFPASAAAQSGGWVSPFAPKR
jgi:hypothetical protein